MLKRMSFLLKIYFYSYSQAIAADFISLILNVT